QGNGNGQNHRETRIDGPGNEVQGENRGMPSGNDGDRKVETYDRVHRENQRRGQAGQEQVRGLVAVPVSRGTAPSQGQPAINISLKIVGGTVTQGGQVRDQPDKPEQQR